MTLITIISFLFLYLVVNIHALSYVWKVPLDRKEIKEQRESAKTVSESSIIAENTY